MNRVDEAFRRLRHEGRKALLPFLVAGDPSLEATGRILREMEDRGVADLVELGVPYSDPIADGPVIQASYQRALGAGVTPQGILDGIARWRREGLQLPLCLMTAYALVLRPGVEAFVARAAEAGVDGLIVPDLPVDESGALGGELAKRGLAHVLLIAPTTSESRRERILEHGTGFIYCVSLTGITGERKTLPPDLEAYIREVKKKAKIPVCVGFGISRPEHVKAVAAAADGAIVGSALVHLAADHAKDSPQRLATAVADLCESLARPLRGKVRRS